MEQFLGSNKVEVLPWIQQSKMVKKNGGIRKMDRSSTIASKEGGSSMIQQLPLVLGAKAYCAVDLECILKKINRNTILQVSNKINIIESLTTIRCIHHLLQLNN